MAASRMPLRPAALLAGAALALAACAAPPSPPTESAARLQLLGYRVLPRRLRRAAGGASGRAGGAALPSSGPRAVPGRRLAAWQRRPRFGLGGAVDRPPPETRLAARGIGLFVTDSHAGRGIRPHDGGPDAIVGGKPHARYPARVGGAGPRQAHRPRTDRPCRLGVRRHRRHPGKLTSPMQRPFCPAARALRRMPRSTPIAATGSNAMEPAGAPFLFLLGEADNYTKAELLRGACPRRCAEPDSDV